MHRAIKLLGKIPKGFVTTYRELAHASGTVPRAAGKILNANRLPKTYPCYRVVMSDGSIGGYNDGVKKKIALLKKDGIEIRNGRIDLKKYLFKFSSVRQKTAHKLRSQRQTV